MKYLLLIIFAYSLNGVAFLILVFRVGRPWHVALSALVWGISWVPLLIAGWIAGEEIAADKSTLQDFAEAHWPYLVLLVLLITIGYLIKINYKKRDKPSCSNPKNPTGHA